ncbi:MAG: Fe-S cluster assembly protein SufD [Kiritimatiellales bacterium]
MTGSLTTLNNPIIEQFAALLPEALEESKDPVAQRAAFEAFAACGLPYRKVEAWIYTDVSKAVAGPFKRPHAGAFGLLVPKPVQLSILPKFPTIGKNDPFALLSCALSHGGLLVTVPPDTVVDELVEIDLPVAGAGKIICPTLVIQVGAGSRVDFLIGPEKQGAGSLVSSIVRVDVGENASVSITKTRTGSGANFCHMQTRQAANSHLSLFEATTGGDLTRNDLSAVLAGEGADIEVNGLYAVSENEHVDNHTTVEHAVPNTVSRQLYKGMLGGHACGVFNGRIVVDPGAKGSDALQMNRNLLSSRSAKVDTKPQLEIGNDDVRCSHGATIGQLDEAQLFYLKSRGMAPKEAEALLARGFVGEVIDLVRSAKVRERLDHLAETFFDREPAA